MERQIELKRKRKIKSEIKNVCVVLKRNIQCFSEEENSVVVLISCLQNITKMSETCFSVQIINVHQIILNGNF